MTKDVEYLSSIFTSSFENCIQFVSPFIYVYFFTFRGFYSGVLFCETGSHNVLLTNFVDQIGLKLRVLLFSSFQMLGLKAWTTIPGLIFNGFCLFV